MAADEVETLEPAIPRDVGELATRLLERADRKGIGFATAESCTGGLLASLLTDVEGRGHCFDRGFVTYSGQSKEDLVGVPCDLIDRVGAVSKPVALAMAQGAVERAKADVAMAVTGFAGKGQDGEEPGLVHIACSGRGASLHREYHFGDIGRGAVRIECLRESLKLLDRFFDQLG